MVKRAAGPKQGQAVLTFTERVTDDDENIEEFVGGGAP